MKKFLFKIKKMARSAKKQFNQNSFTLFEKVLLCNTYSCPLSYKTSKTIDSKVKKITCN